MAKQGRDRAWNLVESGKGELLGAIARHRHPTPMAPPLSLESAPQQHPGVMPPPVQPLATAAQDQLNLMAPPFRPRPRPPALLLPVEMPPQLPVLIQQDELHDLKWYVLLWLQQGGPACVYHGGMWVCPFCQRGHMQWTIRDLLLHAHNIIISPA
jgi:hypothetical protein